MDSSWFIAFAVFAFICFTWIFIMLQIIERKIDKLHDMISMSEFQKTVPRNYKR